MTSVHPLVRLQGVSLSFGQRSVLENISLQLNSGQITTLIGPNGSGKSTLVRLILGLIAPDEGLIERQKGLRIGYMPQKLHIEPTLPLTVERFLRLTGESRGELISAALAEVGAEHLLASPMQNLSGGEMQRTLLARALLRRPRLLVLDEPVQGVDIHGQTELYELIASLRERLDCGILMVSHDLHLVMAATDQVICLNHHICCSGHPEQVGHDPSFRELFGEQGAASLALYSHQHNHSHDAHGNVIADQPQPRCESCPHPGPTQACPEHGEPGPQQRPGTAAATPDKGNLHG